MSLLSTFAGTGFAAARSVIGGESLSIGGGTVLSAVLAGEDLSRDYEMGGFAESRTLLATVSATEFAAAYTAAASSYHGKIATARGQSWRVNEIKRGRDGSTHRIELISTSDSA